MSYSSIVVAGPLQSTTLTQPRVRCTNMLFDHSRVVRDYIIEYLRNNSVRRAFFNTRQNQQYRYRSNFRDWMITGA